MKFADSKSALNSPVVYATDRFNAVVLVLFLFCVALWFIRRGVSCLVLPCSLFSCFFFSIANSSSCTSTTELSKLLTSCLTVIKKQLIKYCEKVYGRSAENPFLVY